MDFIIADHCPIGFSINDKLNIAMNDKILRLDQAQNENEIDIGEKMKARASKNYGVQNFLSNIDLISKDRSEADLRYLWTWFDSKRSH